MKDLEAKKISGLYETLIDAWNKRDARKMAEQYTKTGESIGFDGSIMTGTGEITSQLNEIFSQHPTPPFNSRIKDIRFLGEDSAILRAIAGMIPPGKSELDPELNAHQTLVAVKENSEWKVELFQNTPAQYHGRPDLVERFTKELTS
ncbi:SgcJ/EcaC family oxidoreductase [Virgibacillus byunsanensis]|uniref:SgcJ/EcaC family oxidoreductase n=1 Tax=Virgibacillus byunsanensis TaxID=570945 RepID=A0ABW3LRJ2_9BACI